MSARASLAALKYDLIDKYRDECDCQKQRGKGVDHWKRPTLDHALDLYGQGRGARSVYEECNDKIVD